MITSYYRFCAPVWQFCAKVCAWKLPRCNRPAYNKHMENLEDAKNIKITEDPSLPPATRVELWQKDLELGEGEGVVELDGQIGDLLGEGGEVNLDLVATGLQRADCFL